MTKRELVIKRTASDLVVYAFVGLLFMFFLGCIVHSAGERSGQRKLASNFCISQGFSDGTWEKVQFKLTDDYNTEREQIRCWSETSTKIITINEDIVQADS